jgi:hypothetical protein
MGNDEVLNLYEKIFGIRNETDFLSCAKEVLHVQFLHNELFRKFSELVGKIPGNCPSLGSFPFLPIECFRVHDVLTSISPAQNPLTFVSSGTTDTTLSRHLIVDPGIYMQSFFEGFQRAFGEITGYNIFALLPSYLERQNSSLVYMVDKLMLKTGNEHGGFFLHDFQKLQQALEGSLQTGRHTLLIGVTFALLDFVATLKHKMPGLILVETGGMKGRRREMIREEVHDLLKEGFGIPEIRGEYGMTELCSQAWSVSNGRYIPPPWMKVMIRDLNDPWSFLEPGRSGGINIIDLANLHSCAFIETQDIGRLFPDGSFEVLGRLDGSEMRGCNLMMF